MKKYLSRIIIVCMRESHVYTSEMLPGKCIGYVSHCCGKTPGTVISIMRVLSGFQGYIEHRGRGDGRAGWCGGCSRGDHSQEGEGDGCWCPRSPLFRPGDGTTHISPSPLI